MSNETALVKDPGKLRAELKEFLFGCKETFNQLAQQSMNTERLIRMGLATTSRNPALLKCTKRSWVLALLDSVFYGVEPNPQLGHAYLVPYNNKKQNCSEVQFMLGYKGLILLTTQTGNIYDIDARVVHKNDHFIECGHRNPPFEFEPARQDRGDIVGVYAVGWRLEPQRPKFRYLTRDEVESYRRRSRASESGPWTTDWQPMAMKTAIRRMVALLPIQPGSRLAASLQQENLREEGHSTYTHVWDNERVAQNVDFVDV